MKGRAILISVLALGLMLALAAGLSLAQGPEPQGDGGIQAAPVDTSFTYQGRLNDGGSPANGEYDFRFILYDALIGGSQMGITVFSDDIPVTDGLFTVALDFGNPYDGRGVWLEASVRSGGSAGGYTVLDPRQKITPAPYAIYALDADLLDGQHASSFASADHDHWGETWSGSGFGLTLNSSDNDGLRVSGGNFGVYVNSPGSDGVHIDSPGSGGVHIDSPGGRGVRVYSAGSDGFFALSPEQDGVRVESAGRWGLYVISAGDHGVAIANAGQDGVYIDGAGDDGVYVKNTVGLAGEFHGAVYVGGLLTKAGGGFKIDHPLAPDSKYLNHSFVESPDMMNVYNGNVTTDDDGYATVGLPDYFEALNKDYRYQLTVIGTFAQAIIAQEIEDDQFVIQTDQPNVKVSWQVTGIRHDPWAEANQIPVEEDKPSEEQDTYLHPEVYGMPETRGLAYREAQSKGYEVSPQGR
jgi:hypothetical protein